MGCMNGRSEISNCQAHGGHFDGFSYAYGCTEWATAFNLKMGARQSPIDIPVENALDERNAPIEMKLKFNSNPLPMVAEYSKTTFLTQPSTQAIGEIILTDVSNPTKSQLYQSVGLHFHSKSEHKLSGVQYDSEMHIVFKQSGASVMEDTFCVIGVLFKCEEFEASEHERKLFTSFHPELPNQALSINLGELMERTLLKSMKFLHYKGSLTTPPCTEAVNWFVHPKVFSLRSADLKPFAEKWSENMEFCPEGTGNSRPVCSLNNRTIYKIKAQPMD